MFNTNRYWITIAETKPFIDRAHKALSIQEWDTLTEYLAISPDAGEILDGVEGVRVLKWAAASQGRNGAVRVVYFFRDLNTPVYLLALYEKGERLRLTSAEKRQMQELVSEIVAASYQKRWAAQIAAQSGAA